MVEKKKVALVLAGGGARGMAHIGAIEALEENGFEISSIAGCSIGSVIGALYASGDLPAYKEWMINMHKSDVFRLLDFTLSTSGFIKGEKVFNAMRTFIKDRNIEDLPIPYAAVAVDILNAHEVVIRTGSMFDAMRASIAIPTMFRPKPIGGSFMIDGGVLNNLPVDRVVRTANDILIAIDINANIPKEIQPEVQTKKENEYRLSFIPEKYGIEYVQKLQVFKNQWNKMFLNYEEKGKFDMGLFETMTRSINIMQDYISAQRIKKCPPDLKVDISREECGMFDFHRAEEMVELGRKKTEMAIKAHFLQN